MNNVQIKYAKFEVIAAVKIFKSRSTELWRRVVLRQDTNNVSEDKAASIFTLWGG